MSIPIAYKGKYFFHFTHVSNLESICKNGILSTNRKRELGIIHKDVANPNIQERRSNMDITCEPFGKVHDYVPFYWCTINPMLLALVNSKNIDQQEVVFLAIPINKILEPNVIFSDASANTINPPNFFKDPSDLDKLDWIAINLTKWKSQDDDERHRRMAEVLIYQEVPFSDVEYIITWNQSYSKAIKNNINKLCSNPPQIIEPPFQSRYFYFTQYPIGKPRNSLVTGPYWLKREFDDTISNIKETRKANSKSYRFKNISDLIQNIDSNFKVLPELKGIFELETSNYMHNENVSDHTMTVVKNVISSEYYKSISKKNQDILKLSAYLHDIGKGPKSRWNKEIQPVYPDHPVDALPMLERILSFEIEQLKKDDIRKVCMLVAYHDLIGEIIGKNRDEQQLHNIIKSRMEFEMLSCLSYADVLAIDGFDWAIKYNQGIGSIRKKVEENFA